MSLTLLVDLDDTLLLNPLESFMPAYIKLLSKKLAPFVAPEKMVPQLMFATEQMIKRPTTDKTLEHIFDDNFYSFLGLVKENIQPVIEDFYLHDFNELKALTQIRPDAIKLIDHAVSKRYTIVVATNPLFPFIALRARLNWAGFETSKFPFKFVTSYENMHFSKPHPEYYSEILGTIGWPRGPVCMVGNSLSEDILPASTLGIPGFWVDGDTQKIPGEIGKFSTAGKLEDVIQWMDKLQDFSVTNELSKKESILAILKTTPIVLSSITEKLDDSDWKKKPTPTDLSVLELIAHLLDVEKEINFPRIELILSTDDPFIVGVDSDTWVTQRNYLETRTRNVVKDLLLQRNRIISLLSRLSEEDWQRPARHSFFGPTTIFELTKFIAAHDIDHIRQIHRIIER